jgi:hypothetical protein
MRVSRLRPKAWHVIFKRLIQVGAEKLKTQLFLIMVRCHSGLLSNLGFAGQAKADTGDSCDEWNGHPNRITSFYDAAGRICPRRCE